VRRLSDEKFIVGVAVLSLLATVALGRVAVIVTAPLVGTSVGSTTDTVGAGLVVATTLILDWGDVGLVVEWAGVGLPAVVVVVTEGVAFWSHAVNSSAIISKLASSPLMNFRDPRFKAMLFSNYF
jgi:hypothetical protein